MSVGVSVKHKYKIQAMKTLLLFILVIVTMGFADSYPQKYRWNVKILIDTAGQRVFKMTAHPEMIGQLADSNINHRPAKSDMAHNKRANKEKRKVTVTAFIIADGIEDDGDYHLVLKDPTGDKTLIGEIPDPAGPELTGYNDLKSLYDTARNFVNKHIGKPPKAVTPLKKPVKVTITGVIFFDKMAHGNGHAENGVEIHPVLGIEGAH